MDIKEFLECEVELIYISEISFVYKSMCTVEEFFAKKIYKDKRLLSARLIGTESNMHAWQSTGPR